MYYTRTVIVHTHTDTDTHRQTDTQTACWTQTQSEVKHWTLDTGHWRHRQRDQQLTTLARRSVTSGQQSRRYFSRYAGNKILKLLSSTSPCGLQSLVNSGSFQPAGTSNSSVVCALPGAHTI